MDALLRLVHDYQATVRAAVALFERHRGLGPPTRPDGWMTSGIPQSGTVDFEGTVRYFLHGYGCAVVWPDGTGVDWDFGDGGEIDGFDPWRLWHFARQRASHYPEFPDEDAVKRAVAAAVAAGSVRRSDYSLYYLSAGRE